MVYRVTERYYDDGRTTAIITEVTNDNYSQPRNHCFKDSGYDEYYTDVPSRAEAEQIANAVQNA